ncbi:adenosylcobinamide-phosphate synthase CbiB [Hoeflea sp. YIM 152468]|uniref:adenosylcobinamide-phosphate synthase CbiB n=1 Tax=Hoeflea sp. YIM 152468 TaxID=3031759 RepID=UPI0023DB158B|nr:adenosylcobinamide-phosphate synthase CbiB [Hoeflea sp. YIM 152468]MDF1607641.1 adenosylcobinamide-phosphate synthase CbiB [Hoeflea sp. YIM 152468]
MSHLLVLLLALVGDRVVGDPDWLWRRISHPVVFFGYAIGFADSRFNRSSDGAKLRRCKGWIVLVLLLGLSALGGWALACLFGGLGVAGMAFEVVVVAVFLAQKSLADHVIAVADGLREGGVAGGRTAVAMIVGRDPDVLDQAGVSRAAIESLAENFSDGIIAPALWYALLGLPGLLAYKMLNTADSMIGHLNERHGDFGRGAAKLDDLANWPAARLSAVLIAAGAGLARGTTSMRNAMEAALVDSGLHRSPNAGWPEAAMAGALGLALAGPRQYGGEMVMEPSLNASGRQQAGEGDIRAALSVFERACDCLATIVLLSILFCI